MTEAHLLSIELALAALSGVRAYPTVFGIGLAGRMGWSPEPASNWMARMVYRTLRRDRPLS